ncbi:DUF779 domain-containing protein [Roseateles saccharophilus]|uniref:DUF779 domain-containing protein n=1 Tax=Roseateles saccharophilus TaxID=304 RepID=A0A4R3UJ29_ROSSA|nr:DUF779 domain-containing protein [Roseateles saccharophilus]MDG0834754.1 DUF779 domain-containing protein [Roseateles saccharophilus]TCU89014.1 hypothetical protein EV671_103645 [Roseateles saccharophilus]
MSTSIPRVRASEAAQALIRQLQARHGELLFYQSHGCCAGSAPMCFAVHELKLNADDRRLGAVDGVPVYASLAQCDYLAGLQMTLDVAPGNSGSFGLEDGSGQHFVAHFRLWTDEELPRLAPIVPV